MHELQDVVTGRCGPPSDDDIVVFKSNGLAAWDLAAAARVVELAALELGLRLRDDVLAERVQHFGTVEQPLDLLGRAAVRHVVVLEDLGERRGRGGARGSRTAPSAPRPASASRETRTLLNESRIPMARAIV